MKHQRGVALSGLIMWGIVIALVAVTGMKVVPSYIAYFKTLKDIKAVVNQVGKEATVPDIKKAYGRFAEIDQLELTTDDLDIAKEGGQIVVSFSYEKKIPLFANVSLVIDYAGTTR